MLHFFLVHLNLLSLDGQLLADSIRVLGSNLAHLAVLQKALEVLYPAFESRVLFLKNHVLLADREELGLSLVELVSKRLKLCLFLLVGTNEALRVVHHGRKVDGSHRLRRFGAGV